jgi:hypothetical protein
MMMPCAYVEAKGRRRGGYVLWLLMIKLYRPLTAMIYVHEQGKKMFFPLSSLA